MKKIKYCLNCGTLADAEKCWEGRPAIIYYCENCGAEWIGCHAYGKIQIWEGAKDLVELVDSLSKYEFGAFEGSEMELIIEEALDEIIVGRFVFQNDKHKMTLYAIENLRMLKDYLPDDSGELRELIIKFLEDEINSYTFKQRVKELLGQF